MTLEELFQRLSYGPLANLAIAGEGSGGIKEEKKPSIVLYANDALLRLHTRFLLIEKELILKQVDGISSYELTPQFTHSASLGDNPPAVIPYIEDTLAKPFQDDLIKILTVYDHSGCEVPLNDELACNSYYTPQNHILQIRHPIQDVLNQVVYQARHPKLSFNPATLTQQIILPSTLEEALLSYIAYLHYSSMNGQENLARGSEYLSRYNAICIENESRGVVNNNDEASNTKLEDRGFA